MFIYVADPLCSWCYGFGPELEALLARFPQESLRLVMGGLRAFNTQPMTPDLRRYIGQHWDEVQRHSGLPFNHALLERDDFIYDTEPACRAVVTAREHAPALAWPLFRALQRAFYAEARDVTRSDVLAEIYAAVHQTESADPALPPGEFAQALDSAAMRGATRRDFRLAREWEVQGFPTLFAERDGHYALLSPGYAKAAGLIERAGEFFGGGDH